MKRLYFLFSVIVINFLYPIEHTQGNQRRVSTTSIFSSLGSTSPVTSLERRGSFLGLFRRKNNSSPHLPIDLHQEKKLTRARTRSAEGAGVHVDKLKARLSVRDPDEEIDKPMFDARLVDAHYAAAKELVEQAGKEKNKEKRKQLLADAAVRLEIPRLAGHEDAIKLLLMEVCTSNFTNRTSKQLDSLERSLLTICNGHSDLLVYFNVLRAERCQAKMDELRCKQIKDAIISLVRIREAKGFEAEHAKKFIRYVEELDARKGLVEAFQHSDDFDLDNTSGAG